MGARRKGREAALQFLYQLDYAQPAERSELSETIQRFFEDEARASLSGKARSYAGKLIRGVCVNKEEIDRMLSGHLKSWSLERLTRIDRTLMEMATFEASMGGVPKEIAINEAIEIAKRFSSEDAIGLINAALDSAIEKTEGSEKTESPT